MTSLTQQLSSRNRLRITAAAAVAGIALTAGIAADSGLGQPARSTAGVHASSVQLDARGTQTVANSTPIFWWNGTRWDYFGFLKSIGAIENAYNNDVPGSSNTVDHTDSGSHSFYDVVIGDRHRNQVRIRIRRSDLYVVGWFTQNDTYNYVGPANEAGIPDSHRGAPQNGRGGSWQLTSSASYAGIERVANEGNPGKRITRSTLTFNADAVSDAANALHIANHRELMGQGVLFFTQFISEAARFRGISDTIGWMGLRSGSERDADGNVLYPHIGTRLPDVLVDMQNDWGNLSQRFNWMLANHVPRDSDQNALSGSYRRPNGSFVRERLFTMEQFSRVLNVVKGYPGRP